MIGQVFDPNNSVANNDDQVKKPSFVPGSIDVSKSLKSPWVF